MTPLEIQPGGAYACRFRTQQIINDQGQLVDTQNLEAGSAVNGRPGVYESTGVIKTRDVNNCVFELIDTQSGRTFVVSWDDCWDIDTAEYV